MAEGEVKSEGKSRRWPRASRRRLASVAVLVIVVAGLFFAISYLSKPAVGTVQTTNYDTEAAPPQQVHNVKAVGKYVSFTYPSNFTALAAVKPAGTQLEILNYAKTDIPVWYLNTQVSSLPSGNLLDDGSYNMRRLDSSRYKLEYWQAGASSVPVFVDSSAGYNKAAFVAHGGKLFTVSITSGDTTNNSTLDATLHQVLNSLEWN